MSCTNCSSSTPLVFNTQLFYNQDCFGCNNSDCGANVQNSKCVIYTGPNLSCAGIETNDSIEFALQKIDEQICAISGDYSTYQFACLETFFGDSITTEADFVNAITSYSCEIRSDLDTFIDDTFSAYQTTVNSRFEAIEDISITCSSAGVTNTDTLQEVLGKYCQKFEDIDTLLDVSTVDWDPCLTVVDTPDNIKEAFELLVDQICQVKSLVGSGTNVTFNNSSSCIAGGTSDSLTTTIGLIKTRLCQTPIFDKDDLLWSCLDEPTYSGDQDITAALQGIIDLIVDIKSALPTFDTGDFAVTQTVPSDVCSGVTVALQTPLDIDRSVAVSVADTAPGTLIDKVTSSSSTLDITNDSDQFLNIEIADGSKGDISVSGNTWTIANDSVTFAKMQNINTSRILGRSSGGSGDVEEVSLGDGLGIAGGILDTVGRTLIDVQVFTSSGTWSKPSGCNAVMVITVGAGGGGADAQADAAEASAGSGGGSGAHQVHFLTSGLGSSETVTIGAGGAAGTSGGNGSSGGFSTFGSHTKAGGGGGGTAMTSDTTAAITEGGSKGAPFSFPTGLLYNGYGSLGERGLRLSASVASGGRGGSSIIGGGDESLTSYGAGGKGGWEVDAGATGAVAAAGGNGIVIVYSYS